MCRKRELTEKSLVNGVNHLAGETLIRTLMRQQLKLMTLIDTVYTTPDAKRRKSAFQGLVDLMKELNRVETGCTCSPN
jgi:hypothetical protein